MKILVIQLTRLGDILCTAPILSALRRENPQAEIHFLVRKRYAGAAKLFDLYDHLWQFDTQKIIGDLISEEAPLLEGLEKLKNFIQELRKENFDIVINLSFSPTSSYITRLVAEEKAKVLGYTRTSDYYLSLPDSGSIYFRAHVGPNHFNKLHVVDLMASVAGVKLNEKDLSFSTGANQRNGVVCHIGASNDKRVWPETSWIRFLNALSEAKPDLSITLVGSLDEVQKAKNIVLQLSSASLKNKVGETSLDELKSLLQHSKLFVGCDSGPLHLASLTECPSLALFVGPVRFWETGPTLQGSRVLESRDPSQLMSDTVLEHTLDILSERHNYEGAAVCVGRKNVRYDDYGFNAGSIDPWWVIQWMYFQGVRPILKGDLPHAIKSILEVCEISLSQIETLHRDPRKKEIIQILDRLDDVLFLIEKNIPPLAPLIEEYRTRKENIPPMSSDEIFKETRDCYFNLANRATTLHFERLEHNDLIFAESASR